MTSRIVLFCVVVAAAALTTGCSSDDNGTKTIVAAFYPLAYAAAEIAGPGVAVVDLTRAGEEPHDLELTPRDVARVRDAALVVYAGDGFQPAVEDAVRGRSGPSLDVLAGLELLGSGDDVDPHVWLDPRRYATIVQAIATALGEPSKAKPFTTRLAVLDRDLSDGLRHCARRTLVTSHAAYGYLAARYGLEQVPLVGLAPEVEPGPGRVEKLVREVKASGATTVFTEPLVSPALADTVAREAGVSTTELDPLEALTPSQEESGADYFDVMRRNLATLRKALGCR